MSKKRKSTDIAHTKSEHQRDRPLKKTRLPDANQLELAHLYNDLASDEELTRIRAALELVQKCKDNNGLGKEPSFDAARQICVRLLRGLCSHRKSARHGFYIALVEVLRLFKTSVDLKQGCLDLVKQHTALEQAGDGQERRDNALGRMSAYTAVVHSRLFFCGSDSQLFRFRLLLAAMLDNYIEEPWLEEQLASVLRQTVSILVEDKAPDEWIRSVMDVVVSKGMVKTPLGIGLWLDVMRQTPHVKLPRDVWNDQNPLLQENLAVVIEAMNSSTGLTKSLELDGVAQDRTGARQKTLSFAWPLILVYLQQGKGSGSASSLDTTSMLEQLAQFWNEAVESNFFNLSSSHEKKHLGLQLLQTLISDYKSWSPKVMLSPNVLHCLISSCADTERYLFSQAKAVLQSIRENIDVQARPTEACEVVEMLLFRNGRPDFDNITGTKTAENVIMQCIGANEQRMWDLFDSLFNEAPSEHPKTHGSPKARRRFIADLLSSLVRKHQTTLKGPSTTSVLKFLAKNTYNRSEDDANSTSTRDTQIESALHSSMSVALLDKNLNTLRTIAEVCSIFVPAIASISMEHKNCANSLRRKLRKLSQSTEAKTDTAIAIDLICIMVVVSLAGGQSEAWDMAEDLLDLDESLASTGSEITSERQTDALVEMLVALVAEPSSLYRRASNWAFDLLSLKMTKAAMRVMLEVLVKKENVSGKQDIEQPTPEEEYESDDVMSEDEVSADEHSNLEIDSDIEEMETDRSLSTSSEDSNADDNEELEDSMDESLEGSESDSSELVRFNEALGTTLGTSNQKKEGSDESDESDESMDDEQMMALEPKLAEVFKHRLGVRTQDMNRSSLRKRGGEKKQQQAAARKSILDFKNRILDMLESFVTKYSSHVLTNEVTLSLLSLVRSTRSKQLRDKCNRIINKHQSRARKKGEPPFIPKPTRAERENADDAVQSTWQVLEAVHDEALQRSSHLHKSLCSQTSLFICRCALRDAKRREDTDSSTPKRLRRIEKIYENTRAQLKTQEKGDSTDESLTQSFWDDFCRWKKDVKRELDRSSLKMVQ